MNSIDSKAVLFNLLNSPSAGTVSEKNIPSDAGQTSQKNPNDFEKLLAKISQPPDGQVGNGNFLSVSNHLLAGGAVTTRSVSRGNPPSQYETPSINMPVPGNTADNNWKGIDASIQAVHRQNDFGANGCELAPIQSDSHYSKLISQKKLLNDGPVDVPPPCGAELNSRSDSSLFSSVAFAPNSVSLAPNLLQDLSIQTTISHSLGSGVGGSNSSASSILANDLILPLSVFNGSFRQGQKISLTVLDQQNHLAPAGGLSSSHLMGNSSIFLDKLSNSNHVPVISETKIPLPATNLESKSAVSGMEAPILVSDSGFSVAPSTPDSSSALLSSQSYKFDLLNEPRAAQGSDVYNSTILSQLYSGFSQKAPLISTLGEGSALRGSLTNKSSQVTGENSNNLLISNLRLLISNPAAGTATKSLAECAGTDRPEATLFDLMKPNVSNSIENAVNLVQAEHIDPANGSQSMSSLGSGPRQNEAFVSVFPSSFKAVYENVETHVNQSQILFGQAPELQAIVQNLEIAKTQPSIFTFEPHYVPEKSSPALNDVETLTAPSTGGAQTFANLPHAKSLNSFESTSNQADVLPVALSTLEIDIPSESIQFLDERSTTVAVDTSSNVFGASITSLVDPALQSSPVASGSNLLDSNRVSTRSAQVFGKNPSVPSSLSSSSEMQLQRAQNDTSPLTGASMLDFVSTVAATDELRSPRMITSTVRSLQNQRFDVEFAPSSTGTLQRSSMRGAIQTGSIATNVKFPLNDGEAKNVKDRVLGAPQSGTLPQLVTDPEEPSSYNRLNGQNREVDTPSVGQEFPAEVEHATDIIFPKSVSVLQSNLGGLASEFSPVGQIAAFIERESTFTASQVSFSSSNAAQPVDTILSSGVKTLSLALEPQDLGGVTIKLRLSSDGLAMVVEADKLGTVQLIEKDKDKLLKRLQESGYSVETLFVKAADSQSVHPQQSLPIEPSKFGDVSNQQNNQSTGLSLRQDNSNGHNGTGQENTNPHTKFAQNEPSFSDVPASLRIGDIYI